VDGKKGPWGGSSTRIRTAAGVRASSSDTKEGLVSNKSLGGEDSNSDLRLGGGFESSCGITCGPIQATPFKIRCKETEKRFRSLVTNWGESLGGQEVCCWTTWGEGLWSAVSQLKTERGIARVPVGKGRFDFELREGVESADSSQ